MKTANPPPPEKKKRQSSLKFEVLSDPPLFQSFFGGSTPPPPAETGIAIKTQNVRIEFLPPLNRGKNWPKENPDYCFSHSIASSTQEYIYTGFQLVIRDLRIASQFRVIANHFFLFHRK